MRCPGANRDKICFGFIIVDDIIKDKGYGFKHNGNFMQYTL